MNDAEFQQLLNASPPVILTADAKQLLHGFFILLGLAIMSLLLVYTAKDASGLLVGRVCVILFGFFSSVSLLAVLFPPSLTLDTEGFEAKSLYRKDSHLWKNVSEFVVNPMLKPDVAENVDKAAALLNTTLNLAGGRSGGYAGQLNQSNLRQTVVLFNDSAAGTKGERNRKLMGYTGVLTSSVYDMTPEQLAKFMNRWRERMTGNASGEKVA